MKKIVSVILAVTLVFVLAAPGLAATDADARAALAALEAYLESNEGKTGTLSLDGKTTLYHAFYVDFDQNGIPELVRVFSTTDVHFPSYADVKYVTKENGNWVVHQTERGFGNGGRGGYSQTSDFGRFSDGNYGFRINIDYTWYDMPSEVYHYKFKGNEFVEAEEGGFQILDEPQDRFALYSLPSVTAAPAVQRSAQSLSVNGQTIDCDKYNIDGSNYFKLRDIAYLLNGTASQFSVLWDSVNQHVIIITGRAYEADKTELVVGADKSAEAQPSVQTIQIDGVVHSDLSAYNIGGNNYFKLRDLGEKLGFTVDYDEATNTAIVKSTEQFIGEHTAASSVTDGEYTVKFAGTHQSVQGGELVDVELIENVCFTDEEIQEFLSAGTFPIGKYYPYAVKDELPFSQSDFSGSFIHLEDYQLYKSKDGLWHLALANDVSITRTAGTGQLFFPACIKVKDASGDPFNPVTHDNIAAAFRKGTPRNNAYVFVKDGAVIICTIGYKP